MAFLENGNTIINDSGNGAFTSLTVTANSRIYIGQNFYTTAAGNIFQGTRYGYVGVAYSQSIPGTTSTIERFSFVNDGNASVIGDMQMRSRDGQLSSSATNGYQAGGFTQYIATIQKFSFAVDYGVKATTVGRFQSYPNTSPVSGQPNMHVGCGQSSIPYGYGYSSGGAWHTSVNRIYKYSFSSDADSIPVGNLTAHVFCNAGHSSTTSGYSSGGVVLSPSAFDSTPAPQTKTAIDKFPFATDTNATAIGNLTAARVRSFAGSSPTSGYMVSGSSGYPTITVIASFQKFPFASDTNATAQSATLTTGRYSGGDASSVSSGYVASGLSAAQPAGSVLSSIEKYSFVSDTNATSVGNLVIARHNFTGGHQV
jgi:hypothetical protein